MTSTGKIFLWTGISVSALVLTVIAVKALKKKPLGSATPKAPWYGYNAVKIDGYIHTGDGKNGIYKDEYGNEYNANTGAMTVTIEGETSTSTLPASDVIIGTFSTDGSFTPKK